MLACAAAFFDVTPWRWAYVELVSIKLLANALAWLALRHDKLVMPTQGLNTTADVVLLTAAIYFTGGAYSPLLATYVIVVAVLSLLSNLGVTVMMAGLILVLFAAMVSGWRRDLLPATQVPGAPGQAPSLGYTVTAIVYCALVVGVPAWFSAATLRLLRVKERDLEARTEQLIQANTQRSQFVASMTHELRTPIHGVQGLADVIAAGVYGPVTDKQKEACASIKRSAQSLLGLVDDVLNLARADAGRIEARRSRSTSRELVERVTASVSWMVGTKKIHLEAVVERDLAFVNSDPRWLAHVLVNLVSNAVKFTPEGGRVRVGARAGRAVPRCRARRGSHPRGRRQRRRNSRPPIANGSSSHSVESKAATSACSAASGSASRSWHGLPIFSRAKSSSTLSLARDRRSRDRAVSLARSRRQSPDARGDTARRNRRGQARTGEPRERVTKTRRADHDCARPLAPDR